MPLDRTRVGTATVVVVSFGPEDFFLGEVEGYSDTTEIVVVDQHAEQHASAMLGRSPGLRDRVRVVNSGANRGFGAGCNTGAANAHGDVLVFLNPDARISADDLAVLTAAALRSPGYVIGPRIFDQDGDDVSNVRNWTTPARDVAELLVPSRLTSRRNRRDLDRTDPRVTGGGPVPYVQGSCFAITREAFWALGGFDEDFFLYGEEEDLARRCLAGGSGVLFDPEASAIHKAHTSSDDHREFAVEQFFRSRVLTYRKHRGGTSVLIGFTVNYAAVCLLLLTTPVRRAVGFRRTETATWCRYAARGLVAGLLGKGVSGPSGR